jgi:hypothetical protein
MLFGIFEMKEFAKNHEDERVKVMMRKIEGLTNKAARQHETILKLENDIRLANKDWCEEDEAIKKLALTVLPGYEVEGDEWHIPRTVELVEMIVDRLSMQDYFYKISIEQRNKAWEEVDKLKEQVKILTNKEKDYIMDKKEYELFNVVQQVFGAAACSPNLFAIGLGCVACLTGREVNEELKNDVMNILQNMPSTID